MKIKKLKHYIKVFLSALYLFSIFLTAIVAMCIGGAVVISDIFHINPWIAATIYATLLFSSIPIFIWLNKD